MTAPRRELVAADVPGLLRTVLAALAIARQEIDDLNVFPVPDGDTGTNLHTTVAAALEAVDRLDGDADDEDNVARAASRGALRGAAGNSGVILSQVVRAVVEHLATRPLDAATLAEVVGRARDLAYEAVAEPMPGTILSAMDAAVGAAQDLPADATLDEAVALLVEAVGDAVAASRDVLEANRHAGVVDAGARGFEVVLDGILAYVEGRSLEAVPPPPVRRTVGEVVSRESGSLTYAYEVQYLLEAPDEVAPTLREALEGLGDSVVVVACGGLLNVHVHTNDVDGAIGAGGAHGTPARVHVTAFADDARSAGDGADRDGAADDPPPVPPRPPRPSATSRCCRGPGWCSWPGGSARWRSTGRRATCRPSPRSSTPSARCRPTRWCCCPATPTSCRPCTRPVRSRSPRAGVPCTWSTRPTRCPPCWPRSRSRRPTTSTSTSWRRRRRPCGPGRSSPPSGTPRPPSVRSAAASGWAWWTGRS